MNTVSTILSPVFLEEQGWLCLQLLTWYYTYTDKHFIDAKLMIQCLIDCKRRKQVFFFFKLDDELNDSDMSWIVKKIKKNDEEIP